MNDNRSPFADQKVPFPDAVYATRTTKRLGEALVPGAGLGALTTPVSWVGRMQATVKPRPFDKIVGLAVVGSHAGGYAAGDDDPAPGLDSGAALVSLLAERAGVSLDVVKVGESAATEDGPALADDQYFEALERGARLADSAIDSGADLIVLCGLGAGTTAAAIAVASHMTRTPPVELSPRLLRPGGLIDDASWMTRTAAIRDTFARLDSPKRDAPTALTEIGGAVLATAAAVIVGAALRRTPLLLDGPVGFAAALVARDFSLGAPKWSYAPDRIPHPVVDKAAKQIGMPDPLGFGLDIGEGCAAMNAVPLLQDALRLADQLPFPEEPQEAEEEPGEEPPADDDAHKGEDPSTMA
ncbi:MAG: nicotinate-nucleotide--dimethylbenzimidazole phosphoribosyltransferase [Stackebrandtia sp.]